MHLPGKSGALDMRLKQSETPEARIRVLRSVESRESF
jgi:hypothetical protein